MVEEQLNLRSLEQLKSMEKSQNSQGTPTSQVTIVENATTNKSMSINRPPLLRKPNQVSAIFFVYHNFMSNGGIVYVKVYLIVKVSRSSIDCIFDKMNLKSGNA